MTERTPSNLTSAPWKRVRFQSTLAFFAIFACFCLAFHVGPCYEGDDAHYVLGGYLLPHAMAGDVYLYRYDMQPLSYWLIHVVYQATGHVKTAELLSIFLGATGVALLYSILVSRVPRKALLPVGASILLFPELIHTCLYMNTTAIALPFIALSILLLMDGDRSAIRSVRSARWRVAAAALSFAAACLCRFPLVVAAPVLATLIIQRWTRGWTRALAFLAISTVTLALCWGLGFFSVAGITGIFQRHATSPATVVTFSDRLQMGGAGINPLGWGLLALAACHRVYLSIRARAYRALIWLPSVLILIAPVMILTTPKYLLMFYVFAAIFLAGTIADMSSRLRPGLWRGLRWSLIVATGVVQCLTVVPTTRFPFVDIRRTVETMETADGPRTWGAYARQYAVVAYMSTYAARSAKDLTDKIEATPGRYWVIAEKSGWKAYPAAPELIYALLHTDLEPDIREEAVVFRNGETVVVLATPEQLDLAACRNLYAKYRDWRTVAFLSPDKRKRLRWPMR